MHRSQSLFNIALHKLLFFVGRSKSYPDHKQPSHQLKVSLMWFPVDFSHSFDSHLFLWRATTIPSVGTSDNTHLSTQPEQSDWLRHTAQSSCLLANTKDFFNILKYLTRKSPKNLKIELSNINADNFYIILRFDICLRSIAVEAHVKF